MEWEWSVVSLRDIFVVELLDLFGLDTDLSPEASSMEDQCEVVGVSPQGDQSQCQGGLCDATPRPLEESVTPWWGQWCCPHGDAAHYRVVFLHSRVLACVLSLFA